MKRLSILFIFLLLLFACSNKRQEKQLSSSSILEEKGVLSLQLDSVTAYTNMSYGITETEQGEVFSMLNAYDNSIKIFNLSLPSKSSSIYLEKEGKNGIGQITPIVAHLYVNRDSIFIYNQWTKYGLFLINSKAEVIDKFNVPFENKDLLAKFPYPMPSGGDPIVKVGNKLYFTCGYNLFQKKFSEQPMILEFDITNKTSRYIFPLSKKYDKGFWGSSFRYIPSFAYNPSINKFIISYMIDEKLYFGNAKSGKISLIDKDTSSKFIASPEIYADIDYGFAKNPEYNKINEFTLSNSDYTLMRYDPYQSVYYRVVNIRPSKADVKRGQTTPNISIIVLDSNFNKIGEQFFDTKKYDRAMILVSKKGLLIARKDLYDKNEDELSFSIFKIKKNEKK